MKTFIPYIAACTVLLSLTLSCSGPLPYENPLEMADMFTEAFVVKVNPEEMERYCDAEGSAYLDTAFYAVDRRSPQMFEYLLSWMRGMRLTYTRNPIEFAAEVAPEAFTGDTAHDITEATSPDSLATGTPHAIPQHISELAVTYKIVSEKDPEFSREHNVKLRKDHKGRWKVCGCDFTLFW